MLNKRAPPNDEEGKEFGLMDAPNKLTALMSPRLSMLSSTVNRSKGTNSLLSETKSTFTPRVFMNQAKKAADEEVNE